MRDSTIETVTAAPETSVPSTAVHPTPMNKLADFDGDASSLSPFDVSPLQWWRTTPADQLSDAQHLLLRATLQNIATFTGRQWLACLHEDAAACIRIALRSLGTLPITEIALEVDLAMSFLMASALGGNAGSALVLSHILRRVPIDHPFARKLSVSWLVLNLRRALEAKEAAKGRAVETRRAPTSSDADGHRAAFYAGDFA